MKEKLINALGSFGGILYAAFTIAVSTFPIVAINLPFWIDIILIGLVLFFPSTSAIFWVWGLIATILGPQDILAVIYYVLFAVMFLPYFSGILFFFFQKKEH